jgi:decaprenyl-phosphate phosphoribosyltransferase
MKQFVVYFNLFRYWQWLKNIILFIPLFLTDITNTKLIIDHLGLFILFSLFVSSTYILNDIKDREEDRKHPQKNKRPIASGEVSINESIFLFVFIFLATIYLTYYFYGFELLKLFIYYLILTIFYSYKLKYINFLDSFVVSLLYINRLFLGSVLSEITLTYQLTLYVFFLSMFIFYLKKNSILNIDNYTNKLKEKISFQNFKIEISLVVNTLFIILNTVLAWWIFGYIDSSTDYLFGFLFFILHIVIMRDLISMSNQGLLEDISRTVFLIKNLKIKIFFVFTLFVLFYYV